MVAAGDADGAGGAVVVVVGASVVVVGASVVVVGGDVVVVVCASVVVVGASVVLVVVGAAVVVVSTAADAWLDGDEAGTRVVVLVLLPATGSPFPHAVSNSTNTIALSTARQPAVTAVKVRRIGDGYQA